MQHKEDELRSRSYLLAVEDKEFLQKDELRAFRLALEFSKADLALAEMVSDQRLSFLAARASSPPSRRARRSKRLEGPAR